MHINDLLATAVKRGASDLHMKVGSFPMLRIDGTLLPANQEKRLDPQDMEGISATLLNPVQRQKFEKTQEVDVAYACRAWAASAATCSSSAARSAWSSASFRRGCPQSTSCSCRRC